MKIVCAWCKKEMGNKDGDNETITHGMCEQCETKFEKQIEELLGKHKPKTKDHESKE